MMIDDAAERFRDAYGIDELTDPSALSQVGHFSLFPSVPSLTQFLCLVW